MDAVGEDHVDLARYGRNIGPEHMPLDARMEATRVDDALERLLHIRARIGLRRWSTGRNKQQYGNNEG